MDPRQYTRAVWPNAAAVLGFGDAPDQLLRYVIATAERLKIERILTVDKRDLRAVRPKSGWPFVLLPADGK